MWMVNKDRPVIGEGFAIDPPYTVLDTLSPIWRLDNADAVMSAGKIVPQKKDVPFDEPMPGFVLPSIGMWNSTEEGDRFFLIGAALDRYVKKIYPDTRAAAEVLAAFEPEALYLRLTSPTGRQTVKAMIDDAARRNEEPQPEGWHVPLRPKVPIATGAPEVDIVKTKETAAEGLQAPAEKPKLSVVRPAPSISISPPSKEAIEAVRAMATALSSEIPAVVNTAAYVTGSGEILTLSKLLAIKAQFTGVGKGQKIKAYLDALGAKRLETELPAKKPLDDNMFRRKDLDAPAIRALIEHAVAAAEAILPITHDTIVILATPPIQLPIVKYNPANDPTAPNDPISVDWENLEYARWLPAYRIFENENDLIGMGVRLLHTETLDPKYKPDIMHVIGAIRECENAKFYGTGSPEGQFQRLMTIHKVAGLVAVGREQAPEGLAAKRWLEQLDTLFPIRKRPAELQMPGFEECPADENFFSWMTTKYKDYSLISINAASDAGPLYHAHPQKRRDSTPMDITQAHDLMELLHSLDLNASQPLMRTVILNARLCYMKPKADVYERKEFYTKTRNVFVLNVYAQIMAHLATHVMYKNPIHAFVRSTQEGKEIMYDEGVRSIVGWSPWHGGMNQLVQALLDRKRGSMQLVYADNLYLKFWAEGKFWWASLDGEKMEACHTVPDLRLCNRRVMDWWGMTDKTHPEWNRYLLGLDPLCGASAYAVFGNLQIKVPGLVSGKVGTAYYNTIKMLRVLYMWSHLNASRGGGLTYALVRENGEWRLPDLLIEALRQVGVRLKIEKVTDIDQGASDGFLELDMLGFDARDVSAVAGVGVWIPTLDKTRLLNSLAFPKMDLQAEEKRFGALYMKGIQLARLRALYIIGGWSHVGLDMILQSRCQQIISEIDTLPEFTKEEKIDAIRTIGGLGMAILEESEDELTADLAETFSQRAVPSLEDVYLLGSGNVINFVEELHKSLGVRRTLTAHAPEVPAGTDVSHAFPPRPEYKVRAQADEVQVLAAIPVVRALRRAMRATHEHETGIALDPEYKNPGDTMMKILGLISQAIGLPITAFVEAKEHVVDIAAVPLVLPTDKHKQDLRVFAADFLKSLPYPLKDYKAAIQQLREEYSQTQAQATWLGANKDRIPDVSRPMPSPIEGMEAL